MFTSFFNEIATGFALVVRLIPRKDDFASKELVRLLPDNIDPQIFYFFSRPIVPAQKFKARFYGRIAFKAVDIHVKAELLPAIVFVEIFNNLFKFNTMQWIVWLLLAHPFSAVSFNFGRATFQPF